MTAITRAHGDFLPHPPIFNYLVENKIVNPFRPYGGPAVAVGPPLGHATDTQRSKRIFCLRRLRATDLFRHKNKSLKTKTNLLLRPSACFGQAFRRRAESRSSPLSQPKEAMVFRQNTCKKAHCICLCSGQLPIAICSSCQISSPAVRLGGPVFVILASAW